MQVLAFALPKVIARRDTGDQRRDTGDQRKVATKIPEHCMENSATPTRTCAEETKNLN